MYKVQKAEVGIRLSAFLAKKLPQFSQKKIKQAIDLGACHINGKQERYSSYKVYLGETITFNIEMAASLTKKQAAEILFEDEDILVCNKPAGVECVEKDIQALFPAEKVLLVHRLDRETSGALMLAKNKEMQAKLESLFFKRLVIKLYIALVHGVLSKGEHLIQTWHGKVDYKHNLYGSVSATKGKEAITTIEVSKTYSKYSLVKCFPKTGRTHQIRVHLKEMGHPIIGDHLYGKKYAKLQGGRLLLHAMGLMFTHPKTKQKIQVRASTPSDFKVIEKR